MKCSASPLGRQRLPLPLHWPPTCFVFTGRLEQPIPIFLWGFGCTIFERLKSTGVFFVFRCAFSMGDMNGMRVKASLSVFAFRTPPQPRGENEIQGWVWVDRLNFFAPLRFCLFLEQPTHLANPQKLFFSGCEATRLVPLLELLLPLLFFQCLPLYFLYRSFIFQFKPLVFIFFSKKSS